LKAYASVPFGLLLFTAGVVAGLCLRSRAERPAAPVLEGEGVDYLCEAGAIDLFQIEAGKLGAVAPRTLMCRAMQRIW
jgi:hypothetical protein